MVRVQVQLGYAIGRNILKKIFAAYLDLGDA